jgi:endonuclease-8
VPEGDSILWAATRMRPVLAGKVPDEISTPQRRHAADRWPERLGGRAVVRVDTHGKHLFIRFENSLVLHSHLRMTGAWDVQAIDSRPMRAPSRVWLTLRVGDQQVVEFDGPVLELMTSGRVRSDQRLSGLGPDLLAPEFDSGLFLRRLRGDDPTRPLGEALIDQRNVAGIGNIWKSEGCWEAHVDPWRRVSAVSDEEAVACVMGARPRMLRSGMEGPRHADFQVYRRSGGGRCPRCGSPIRSKPQGDDNRMTYWCPGCQH